MNLSSGIDYKQENKNFPSSKKFLLYNGFRNRSNLITMRCLRERMTSPLFGEVCDVTQWRNGMYTYSFCGLEDHVYSRLLFVFNTHLHFFLPTVSDFRYVSIRLRNGSDVVLFTIYGKVSIHMYDDDESWKINK